MKRWMLTAMLTLMSAALVVGCKASAEVEDDDAGDHDTYYKKTTVRHDDGDRTVKTEVKRD